MEKVEPSDTAVGNIKWYTYFGRHLAVPKELNILFNWLSNSIPGMYSTELKICLHKCFYINVHSSIVHNSQRVWKQSKYLSVDEWINKLWCVSTTEYCIAINMNEVLIRVTTWISLENIMINERSSQSQRNTPCMIPFTWNVQNRKSIDRENILVVLSVGRRRCWEKVTAKGYRVTFWGNENTLNLDCDDSCPR